MGLPTCLCKCALGIINSLILIVGLLIAAVGGILLAMANNDAFSRTLESLIKKIISQLGVIDGNSTVQELSFTEFLRPAAIVFLVVGLVIAGIAVIGYCGLSCYTIILKLYVVILIIILVAEIIVMACFFTKTFDPYIRELSTTIINEHYVDIDSSDLYSVACNIIMLKFQCCGLDGYQDFYSATKWNSTREIFNDQRIPYVANLTTPIACCKTIGTFPSIEVIDNDCAVAPDNNISNWNTGCWKKVSDDLTPYRTGAILIIIAGFIVQGVLIAIVLLIICDEGKSIVRPV